MKTVKFYWRHDKQSSYWARKWEKISTGYSLVHSYHAVFYPSNPGKIRVSFDCKAKWHFISVNKSLMPGLILLIRSLRYSKNSEAKCSDGLYWRYLWEKKTEVFWFFYGDKLLTVIHHPKFIIWMCMFLVENHHQAAAITHYKKAAADNDTEVAENLRDNLYVNDMCQINTLWSN